MPENLPEDLQPAYADGNKEVGQQLRDFFIDLLKDKNLYDYHQDRDGYIDRHVSGVANDLLKSQAFIDIERHILAVDGSSRAKPLFVVCPPY